MLLVPRLARRAACGASHGAHPSVATSTLGLLAGYILVIRGDPWAQAAGAVTLGVVVPVVLTLADRAFRTLR
jgi:hypothetical protein